MEKTVGAGFQFTPIEKLLDDCLAWFEENHPFDYAFGVKNGTARLNKERETQLLKK